MREGAVCSRCHHVARHVATLPYAWRTEPHRCTDCETCQLAAPEPPEDTQ